MSTEIASFLLTFVDGRLEHFRYVGYLLGVENVRETHFQNVQHENVPSIGREVHVSVPEKRMRMRTMGASNARSKLTER